MHTSQASAPVLKVWSHAHSCHLALALLVAISILYVRADQTLGGARHSWCWAKMDRKRVDAEAARLPEAIGLTDHSPQSLLAVTENALGA
jgi:hypothetical protein